MRRIFWLAVLILACSVFSLAESPRMLQTTEWIAQHLNDPNLVILHVATDRKSYDAGHIPGARFLAMSDIAVTRNGIPNELPGQDALVRAFERVGVTDASRVVLYGDNFGLYAARAYFTLDYLGKGNRAALLDGGLEKWKAENRQVTTAAPAVTPGRLTVKPRPNVLVDLAAMRGIVQSGKQVLIDARPPDEFSGAKAGDGVSRAGHIPGAKNVFWVNNLASTQNPVLKPVADLRATYAAAGVKRGQKVVVYCRTGVQASHDYFTLKLAGYDPVLYDGSFLEWSNAPGTAVEKSGQH